MDTRGLIAPQRGRPVATRLRAALAGVRARRGFTLVEVVLVVAMVGVLVTLGLTSYLSYIERTRRDRAAADVVAISVSITEFNAEYGRLPADLTEIAKNTVRDPWDHAYQYVNHSTAAPGAFRKDKNIVPINTDFDLYSMGKDGASAPALTAASSRDDIVRANNGGFVGLASVYDP
jgi:general secretion pathway protein G